MSHEDSKQHLFAKLMQPCLVPLRDGRVVDVGSERNQKSIEFYTTCFPTRCLASNHLVVHVAQVSKTIPRTDPPLCRARHVRRDVGVRAADDSVQRFGVVSQPRCTFQCGGPVGAPRVVFLRVWITGICRSSHWSCGNLMLHCHQNTNDLVDVLDLWQC